SAEADSDSLRCGQDVGADGDDQGLRDQRSRVRPGFEGKDGGGRRCVQLGGSVVGVWSGCVPGELRRPASLVAQPGSSGQAAAPISGTNRQGQSVVTIGPSGPFVTTCNT